MSSSVSSAVGAAQELVDWLEKETNSWVVENKYKAGILKLYLRFIIHSLKVAEEKLSEDSEMKDLGKRISKLHMILLSENGDVDFRVMKILPDLKAASSSSSTSYRFVVEHMHSLQKVLHELSAFFWTSSYSSLKRELGRLKCLISLTAKLSCYEDVEAYVSVQLYTRVQAITHGAALLGFSYQCGNSRLALEEILVKAVEESRGSFLELYDEFKFSQGRMIELNTNTNTAYDMDETVVSFLYSICGLFESLQTEQEKEMQRAYLSGFIYERDYFHGCKLNKRKRCNGPDLMPGKDLVREMKSLITFLAVVFGVSKDHETMKFSAFWKSHGVSPHVEDLIMEAATSICRYEKQMPCAKLITRLSIYNEVVGVKQLSSMSSNLRALDSPVRSLETLLRDGACSTSSLNHRVQELLRDMEFLQSFLNAIAGQQHWLERLDDLWRRIICMGKEIYYVFVLALAEDDASHFRWTSHLVEEMKLIKTEISEFQIQLDTKKSMSALSSVAAEILKWLEDKDEAEDLKLDLGFLITSLDYTANRCNTKSDEDLQHQFTRMVVELHKNDLLRLLAPSSRWTLLLDSPPLKLEVYNKISLVQANIRQVLIASSLSRLRPEGYGSSSNALAESLQKLCTELPQCLSSSLVGQNLRCLKFLISLAAKRRNVINNEEVNESIIELLPRAEAVFYFAAHLSSSMMTYGKDVAVERKLHEEFNYLAGEIDPNNLGVVNNIYYVVFKALKSSQRNMESSTDYEMDGSVIDFVDSLAQRTSKLLMPESRALGGELTSLCEFLKVKFSVYEDHKTKFSDFWRSNNALQHLEILLIEAGCILYSSFEPENQTHVSKLFKGSHVPVYKLLKTLKAFNKVVHVHQPFHQVMWPQINNFVMIDQFGTLDILLCNLKELLNNSDLSTSLLAHLYQAIQRDLEFLQSFLNSIAEQHHGQQKLQDLLKRIVHVVYETEYLIDLALVGLALIEDYDNHVFWIFDLVERMNLIKTETSELEFSGENRCAVEETRVAEISGVHGLPQMNSPKLDEVFVGFKDEEEKVLGQLVQDSKRLEIISIVGMPGLGKTFLAHKIYNNPKIKSRFDIQAWCSISQQYERRKLLTNILCQVKDPQGDISKKSDGDLALELKQSLSGQRYLIVLDDIWDTGAWDALRQSFPDDKKESRILFTSRTCQLDSRANFLSKIQIHSLRRFTDAESLELLERKIFHTEKLPLELIEVGQQIAKRCNGLPLAVVVVAGVLARTVQKQGQWEEVRDSLVSYIMGDPENLGRGILELSYNSLPDHLKQCFLYLGAFPEDKEISVRKLARLWIAEGFVRQNNTNLEDLAEKYLEELINRSLVISSKKRSTDGVKTCLLHDLVREFCLIKAKEYNFFLLTEGRGDMIEDLYNQRRVVVRDTQGEAIWSKCSGRFVRSLLMLTPSERTLVPYEVSSIIDGFKLLKVLDLMSINLGNCFPQAMKKLVLLRYLAVFGDFGSLPSSLASLRSLETLIVKGAIQNLLPDTILKMTKLRHLLIDYFTFSGDWNKDSDFHLDNIQTISRLELFDANDLKLFQRFPSLKKLTCVFRDLMVLLDVSVKETFELLTQLETLKISYPGKISGYGRSPGMFSLPRNIKKLTLSGFRLSWEESSVLGNLCNLEVLKLLYDAFEGDEWNMEDEGVFPKLRFLKLKSLDIKRWVSFSEDYFPSIEHLVLDRCYQLEDIPSCLKDNSTLLMIQVYRCNDILKEAIKDVEKEKREFGDEEFKIDI